MTASDLAQASPAIPLGADGPVFTAPWEARVFAMTVQAHEAGVFTWPEWADALSAELAAAGPGDDAENYYRHWMSALEKLAAAKQATSGGELDSRREQWQRATDATPHGETILMSNDPLANQA